MPAQAELVPRHSDSRPPLRLCDSVSYRGSGRIGMYVEDQGAFLFPKKIPTLSGKVYFVSPELACALVLSLLCTTKVQKGSETHVGEARQH